MFYELVEFLWLLKSGQYYIQMFLKNGFLRFLLLMYKSLELSTEKMFQWSEKFWNAQKPRFFFSFSEETTCHRSLNFCVCIKDRISQPFFNFLFSYSTFNDMRFCFIKAMISVGNLDTYHIYKCMLYALESIRHEWGGPLRQIR